MPDSETSKEAAWFEDLYRDAAGETARVPWADNKPNPNLIKWIERERPNGRGLKCAVSGCGLGDDAELLDRQGFSVTAFDVSPTAIEWAKKRFPSTRVKYEIVDLFELPESFSKQFDFVFEAYTIQALPESLRERAIEQVASLVAPQGKLLVICRGRNIDDDAPARPWPLTFNDIASFELHGLRCSSFEDFEDEERNPPVRRFRALFERA
ncbi:MAG TPA: class I SAM-dependent methyltransferase [Tepidisphaeraceae bacterium]|nr:class I SAM-dependent methyltransferase [Tepidisphaeraceae bacterium]